MARARRSRVSASMRATYSASVRSFRLMTTFQTPPRTPAKAIWAPTAASLMLTTLPRWAASAASSRAARLAWAVTSGTSMAAFRPACMAAWRATFWSGVSAGRRRAAMKPLKAWVSASTASMRRSLRTWARSARATRVSFFLASGPPWARLATMLARAAPRLPARAAMDPPPGAGVSRLTSSVKAWTGMATRLAGSTLGRPSTFCSRWKGATSPRPMENTAVCRTSCTGTPVDLPMARR